MLSLVHGPVAVSCWDPVETLVPAAGMAVWVEGLGLVVIAGAGSSHGGDLYAIQLNGKALRIGQRLAWTAIGWRHAPLDAARNDLPVLARASSAEVVRLPSTTPVLALPSGLAYPFAPFAALADRLVAFADGILYATPLDGGPVVQEAMLEVLSGAGQVMPANLGAGSDWWCAHPGTGKLYRYDAIAGAEVASRRTSLGGSFHCCGYSRKHAVFVALRPDAGVYKLSVYANEPKAATLSAPAFSSSPVRRGRAYEVSARLLGDLGEPCPGRVVSFTATHGEVDPTGVETDADGWARSTYRAPRVAVAGAQLTATMVE
jgi:hypothetical protein